MYLTLFRILWVFGRYLGHPDSDLQEFEVFGFMGMRDTHLYYWLHAISCLENQQGQEVGKVCLRF